MWGLLRGAVIAVVYSVYGVDKGVFSSVKVKFNQDFKLDGLTNS